MNNPNTNPDHIQLQYMYILNNWSNQYSNIMYEYQRVVYNQPYLNTPISEYTNVIQNYQRDMNLILTTVQQVIFGRPVSDIPVPLAHTQPTQQQPQPNQPQTVEFIPPPAAAHTTTQAPLYDTPQPTVESMFMTSNAVPAAATTVPPSTDVSGNALSANTTTNARTPPLSRTNANRTYITTYTITSRIGNLNRDMEQPAIIMEDVVVRPTTEDIQNAVEIAFVGEYEPHARCPISLEEFTPSDYVMRICYCMHLFNGDSLMNWFRQNVRCPVCRYDIRDYVRPQVRDLSNNDLRNRSIPRYMIESNTPENSSAQRTLSRIIDDLITEYTQDPNLEALNTIYNTVQNNQNIMNIPNNTTNIRTLIQNTLQNNYIPNISMYEEEDDTDSIS